MILFRLIKNELIKMFRKKKTIVVFLLFLLVMYLFMYINYYENKMINKDKDDYNLEYYQNRRDDLEKQLNDKTVPKEDKEIAKKILKDIEFEWKVKKGEISWKEEIEHNIKREKENLLSLETDKEKSELQQYIRKQQYYLDNDVEPMEYEFNCGFFSENFLMNIGFIILACGIAALLSDVVSGEFTPPTMKFLLAQPIGRGKIVLSKFIASIITVITLINGSEIISFIGLGIAKGFKVLKQPVIIGQSYKMVDDIQVIIPNSGQVVSYGKYLMYSFLFQILFIIAVTAFIFMLSTVCKSSMVSMVVSIVMVVVGSVFSCMSRVISQQYAQYIFLNYGNTPGLITGELTEQFGNNEIILQNGIIILLITTGICYLISHVLFKRKDILI